MAGIGGAVTYGKVRYCLFLGNMFKKVLVFRGVPFPVIT